jgi:hypothetical protein
MRAQRPQRCPQDAAGARRRAAIADAGTTDIHGSHRYTGALSDARRRQPLDAFRQQNLNSRVTGIGPVRIGSFGPSYCGTGHSTRRCE